MLAAIIILVLAAVLLGWVVNPAFLVLLFVVVVLWAVHPRTGGRWYW